MTPKEILQKWIDCFNAADAEKNNMTSLEVIRAMGNGINLGNTLEAYNHQAYINGSSATSGEIV